MKLRTIKKSICLALCLSMVLTTPGYAASLAEEDPFLQAADAVSEVIDMFTEDPEVIPEEEAVREEDVTASGEENADGDYTTAYEMGGNLNAQNYVRWAKPVTSYLFPVKDGFIKIVGGNTGITVKKLNSSLSYVDGSSKSLSLPEGFSSFGGMHQDSDGYFYAFFGKKNESESNDAEVIRVVKYDADFKEAGSVSLKGANTVEPFVSGSLRAASYENYLYVRTCHRMYSDEEGKNHQASLSFEIDTKDMKITDSAYLVYNYEQSSYVSHSFDQYIIIDDQKNIITLDHGDAYPRAIIMGKYGTMAGNSNYTQGTWKYNLVLPIEGNIGNASGVALGGLDYSSTSYLAAGSSVAQDSSWKEANEYKGRNIFVAAVDRSADFSSAAPSIHWITKYKAGSTTQASAPQLVKLSADSFMLYWNVLENGRATGEINYVYINGKGEAASDIFKKAGYVTDCKPVVSGGKVIWFSMDGLNEDLYSVEVKEDHTSEDPVAPADGGDSKKEQKQKEKEEKAKQKLLSISADYIDGRYYIVKGAKAYIEGTEKLKGDKTYKVEYSNSSPAIVKGTKKGVFKGKNEGVTQVKVTSGGHTTTYRIEVIAPVTAKKLYINKGESAAVPLSKSRLPVKEVKSSKESVVSVKADGELKALEAKKSKISYMIGTKKFKLTAIVCDQQITGKNTVKAGKHIKLKVKKGAPDTKWSIDKKSVATISEKGMVTGVSAGTATVKAENNGKTFTYKITVE